MAGKSQKVAAGCPEKEALTDMVVDLTNALPINDLFPSLISNRVIEISDKADICHERTESRRVDYFIRKALDKPLSLGDTEKFYRFMDVMRQHPYKCGFLVRRLEERIAQHKAEWDSRQGPDVITGMLFMHQHVIPRIAYKWEVVSAFLDYPIPLKRTIKERFRGDPLKCCEELLEDWIVSSNGVKPKTWTKFISVLEEIGDLASVTREIKEALKREQQMPASCKGTAESPTDYSTSVPEPVLAGNDPAVMVKGGKHVGALNRVSPTAGAGLRDDVDHENLKSYAFIIYTKNDRGECGTNIQDLSKLLRDCGVDCDFDLYHKTDDIPDWPLFVKNSINEIIAKNGYILLICSSLMFDLLEQGLPDQHYLEMEDGHIDLASLRSLLRSQYQHFLPVFLDRDQSHDYLPSTLSGATSYTVPISRIDRYNSTVELLQRDYCGSLKSLVTKLTHQREVVKPPVGKTPNLSGNDQPLDSHHAQAEESSDPANSQFVLASGNYFSQPRNKLF